MKQRLILGGQAVIEGVMIKSNNYVVTSVMNEKGEIVTKKEKLTRKGRVRQIPFVRGVMNMYDMLVIGYKSLLWSADIAGEEEKISKFDIFLSISISLLFAIGLFLVLPLFITKFLYGKTIGVIFNLIDGLIRVIIFLLYLAVISRIKDVKRLFQYHGAEHKAVNCYETGKTISIDNSKKFSTIHSRCGTNFLMIVLILSIFLFSFITTNNIIYTTILRILLIPIVVAISYEALKFADKYRNNSFIQLLLLPGLWLQKLTTEKPNDKQLRVAVNSVNTLLKLESGD